MDAMVDLQSTPHLFSTHLLLHHDTHLINPIDGHELLLVGQVLQRLDDLSERGIRIVINQNQVKVLFIFPLQQSALLHCG